MRARGAGRYRIVSPFDQRIGYIVERPVFGFEDSSATVAIEVIASLEFLSESLDRRGTLLWVNEFLGT